MLRLDEVRPEQEPDDQNIEDETDSKKEATLPAPTGPACLAPRVYRRHVVVIRDASAAQFVSVPPSPIA
jgi:hypothetical protein